MSKKLLVGRVLEPHEIEAEQCLEGPEDTLEIIEQRLEAQVMIEQLLGENSWAYQQILALHQGLLKAGRSSLSQIRRNAMNIIDSHFDLYRKRFPIPDRLVELAVPCEDGKTYWLSLSQGNLCFYENPEAKKRLPIWLIDRSGIDLTRMN